MRIKDRIDFWIWGDTILEAWRLDSILSAFDDGVPHDVPNETGQLGWDSTRVREKLVRDKLIESSGRSSYTITSEGMLWLAKGGYVGEIKYARLSRISFKLSLVALLASLIAVSFSAFAWFRN